MDDLEGSIRQAALDPRLSTLDFPEGSRLSTLDWRRSAAVTKARLLPLGMVLIASTAFAAEERSEADYQKLFEQWTATIAELQKSSQANTAIKSRR
jgi:hypothetical protein